MVIWRNMTRALSECLCCNEREGNQIRQFNQIAIKLHANKFTSKSNRKWRHIVYSLSILIGNRFAQCPWENHQYTSDVAHWKLITRMLKFLFSSFTQTNLVPSKSWLEHVPFLLQWPVCGWGILTPIYTSSFMRYECEKVVAPGQGKINEVMMW